MVCNHPIILADRNVPCGKCLVCLDNRRKQWCIRLAEEEKHSDLTYFITLTYNDIFLPIRDNMGVVDRRDIQAYLKQLRRRLENTGTKVRFYITAEYGPKTQRPHYHGLLFLDTSGTHHDNRSLEDIIINSWSHFGQSKGFVSISQSSPGRIFYVTKYCLKNYGEKQRKTYREFMLCSRRPGIGAAFLTDEMLRYLYEGTVLDYTHPGGTKSSMPRYYKDKYVDASFDDVKRRRIEKFEERTIESIIADWNQDLAHDEWQASQITQREIAYEQHYLAKINKNSIL